MKYKIQKIIIENTIWSQSVLFLSLFAFIVYYVCDQNKIQIEGFIGICVAILSLIYTFNTSYFDNKKMFKELFDNFNTKYDNLNNDLNDLVDEINKLNAEDRKSRILDKRENKLINDYLNLCAEEYYWFTRGLIDTEVWMSWFSGIKIFFKEPIFIEKIKKEISNIKLNGDSYYGFFEYCKKRKLKF